MKYENKDLVIKTCDLIDDLSKILDNLNNSNRVTIINYGITVIDINMTGERNSEYSEEANKLVDSIRIDLESRIENARSRLLLL